jgi:hypothetical protein
VHKIRIFFCNSYGPARFTKVANFNPIHVKNTAKIPNMFKGVKKIAKLLLFLLTDSVFCCFEHLFESQDDFLVFQYLVNFENLIYSLDTLHQILFGVLLEAHILSLYPLMSTILEKR